MKRLFLLFVFINMLFIGCVSTPELEYVGDEYYPDRGYFKTHGYLVGEDGSGSYIRVRYRTINGTDDVIVVAKKEFNSIQTVSKTDRVLLKFTDGKELVLKYTSRVSQYERNKFVLEAHSGVIKDFGTLEMVRMETDGGYLNYKATEINKEGLINTFNLIQEAATAKYGK